MSQVRLQTDSAEHHRISIVVPVYDEEDNVGPLISNIHAALKDYAVPWEIILVNDGSSDDTLTHAYAERARRGSYMRVVDLQRNFGQTAAMQAGIDAARGDIIVTMDGDLQNDPNDIPRMVDRLLNEDLDMVAGWRKHRKDDWIRTLPSRIANRLIRRVTGVYLHDYGCSLKVCRSNIIKDVRLYGEMHRFIPAWLAMHTTPQRIKEEVVTHHARRFGASKYGLARTFRVILDLLVVFFFMRYNAKPGHFFGAIGLGFGTAGSLILGYLLMLKMFLGEDIGGRPLLLVGILFIVVSAQFLTTGVMSELISRTYYESSDHKSYSVRNKDVMIQPLDQGWKTPA